MTDPNAAQGRPVHGRHRRESDPRSGGNLRGRHSASHLDCAAPPDRKADERVNRLPARVVCVDHRRDQDRGAMSAAALIVKGLRAGYARHTVLEEINLTVNPGEWCALL